MNEDQKGAVDLNIKLLDWCWHDTPERWACAQLIGKYIQTSRKGPKGTSASGSDESLWGSIIGTHAWLHLYSISKGQARKWMVEDLSRHRSAEELQIDLKGIWVRGINVKAQTFSPGPEQRRKGLSSSKFVNVNGLQLDKFRKGGILKCYYLVIFSHYRGKMANISGLVPMGHAEKWKKVEGDEARRGQYSFRLDVEEFVKRYFKRTNRRDFVGKDQDRVGWEDPLFQETFDPDKLLYCRELPRIREWIEKKFPAVILPKSGWDPEEELWSRL